MTDGVGQSTASGSASGVGQSTSPGTAASSASGLAAAIGVTGRDGVGAATGTSTAGASAILYWLMQENLSLTPTPIFVVSYRLAEALTASDSASLPALNLTLLETLQIAESEALSITTIGRLYETVGLSETLIYTALILAEEGLTASDTSEYALYRLFSAAEVVSIATGVTGTSTLMAALLESLALADVLQSQYSLTATEALELIDQITAAVKARLTSAEALQLTEALSNSFVFVAMSEEAMSLSDTYGFQAALQFNASDGVLFSQKIPLEEDEYQMWVMNADTLGVTQYTQVPFNSLVNHDNHTFGVTETGIYELAGEDDAGSDISAYIRTGMLDFGSSSSKAVPRAYAYVKSDNQIYLKTLTDERGCRKERWYRISRQTDTSLQTRRIKLGRGVQAVRWSFEVRNVDGGSLDLRGLEVLPVVLRRRPRG